MVSELADLCPRGALNPSDWLTCEKGACGSQSYHHLHLVTEIHCDVDPYFDKRLFEITLTLSFYAFVPFFKEVKFAEGSHTFKKVHTA